MKKSSISAVFVFVTMFSFVFAGVSAAQSSTDTDALLKRIDALEKRVAELESAKAPAAAPKLSAAKAESAEISGKAFLAYDYNTGGVNNSANSFKVERAYFTYKPAVGKNGTFRLTTDIHTPNTPDAKNFDTLVKFAYYERANILKDTNLIVGIQSAPWNEREDKAWKYRSIYKTPSDAAGLVPSADFGAAVKGKLPFGEYHVMIANGSGFTKEETSHKKDIQARVTIRTGDNTPNVSLYADKGGEAGGRDDMLGILLDQQIKGFSYGATYVVDKSKASPAAALKINRLYSAFASYDFKATPYSVLARFDKYDPDKMTPNNNNTLKIMGFAYRVDKNTRLILSDQMLKRGTISEKLLKLTLELDF